MLTRIKLTIMHYLGEEWVKKDEFDKVNARDIERAKELAEFSAKYEVLRGHCKTQAMTIQKHHVDSNERAKELAEFNAWRWSTKYEALKGCWTTQFESIEAYQAQVKDLEDQLRYRELIIESQRKVMDEQAATTDDCNSTINSLRRELHDASSKNDILKERLVDLTEEADDLAGEIQTLNGNNKFLTERNESLLLALDAMKAAFKRMKERFHTRGAGGAQ